MHLFIHASIHLCAYVSMYRCIDVPMYACICVSMYMVSMSLRIDASIYAKYRKSAIRESPGHICKIHTKYRKLRIREGSRKIQKQYIDPETASEVKNRQNTYRNTLFFSFFRQPLFHDHRFRCHRCHRHRVVPPLREKKMIISQSHENRMGRYEKKD